MTNTYLIALLIFIFSWIVLDQSVKLLSRYFKEARAVNLFFTVTASVAAVCFYLGITRWNKFFLIVLAFQALLVAQVFLERIIRSYLVKEKNKADLLNGVARFILWLFGALFVLSNLGVNITSVVAGLGIGGIAIAFALQNILADLFSSFAIYLDKPFEIGDFVVIGEHTGIIERVGIKTTRLRALQGEEIIIPNREITSTRIQNFKQMKRRRSLFVVSLDYKTTSAQIIKIKEGIKKIITTEDLAEFDRVHFVKFNSYSLDLQVSYYVLSGDYVCFLDTQERILIAIKDMLAKNKVNIPFPTQTIYTNE